MNKRKEKPPAPAGISVAGHPRSAVAVRRAKGLGGVLGALLALGLGLNAGLPPFDAMVRALVAGVVGYVAFWAVAVTVARQLVVAEVRARYAELARAQAAAEGDGG